MALSFFVVTSFNALGQESLPTSEFVYDSDANFWPIDYGVTLSWSSVASAVNYRIYKGTTTGVYTEYLDVGLVVNFNWATGGFLGEQGGTSPGSPPTVAPSSDGTYKHVIGDNTGLIAPTSLRVTNRLSSETWVGFGNGRLLLGNTLNTSIPALLGTDNSLNIAREDGNALSSISIEANTTSFTGTVSTPLVSATELDGDLIGTSSHIQLRNFFYQPTEIAAANPIDILVIGDGGASNSTPRGALVFSARSGVAGEFGFNLAHGRSWQFSTPPGVGFTTAEWWRPTSASSAYIIAAGTNGTFYLSNDSNVGAWITGYGTKTSQTRAFRSSWMGSGGYVDNNPSIAKGIAVGVGGGVINQAPIVNLGTTTTTGYSQPIVPDLSAALNDAWWFDSYPTGTGTYRWVCVGDGGIIWKSIGANNHTEFVADTSGTVTNLKRVIGCQRMCIAAGTGVVVYNNNILNDTWTAETHAWFSETHIGLFSGVNSEVSPWTAYLVTSTRILTITFDNTGGWSWTQTGTPTVGGPYITAAGYDKENNVLVIAENNGRLQWKKMDGSGGWNQAMMPLAPGDQINVIRYERGLDRWWLGGDKYSSSDPIMLCTLGSDGNFTP